MKVKVIEYLEKVGNGTFDENTEIETLPFEKQGYCVMGILKYKDVLEALKQGALELNNRVKIIEEERPIEKLGFSNILIANGLDGLKGYVNERNNEVLKKINELVDTVNELKKGNE